MSESRVVEQNLVSIATTLKTIAKALQGIEIQLTQIAEKN